MTGWTVEKFFKENWIQQKFSATCKVVSIPMPMEAIEGIWAA